MRSPMIPTESSTTSTPKVRRMRIPPPVLSQREHITGSAGPRGSGRSGNADPAHDGRKPRVGAHRVPGLVDLEKRQSGHVLVGRSLQKSQGLLTIPDLCMQAGYVERG